MTSRALAKIWSTPDVRVLAWYLIPPTYCLDLEHYVRIRRLYLGVGYQRQLCVVFLHFVPTQILLLCTSSTDARKSSGNKNMQQDISAGRTSSAIPIPPGAANCAHRGNPRLISAPFPRTLVDNSPVGTTGFLYRRKYILAQCSFPKLRWSLRGAERYLDNGVETLCISSFANIHGVLVPARNCNCCAKKSAGGYVVGPQSYCAAATEPPPSVPSSSTW